MREDQGKCLQSHLLLAEEGRELVLKRLTLFFRLYAHTQSSLALLERVSVCVANSEPVLLVGETGVGKTATISYLAQLTGM